MHEHTEPQALPPRQICIAAALAIATGVSAIIDMLIGLVYVKFTFDLGFVGIPIGYGLLIGKASSRNWAEFFAIAGMVILTAIGIYEAYKHWSATEPLTQAEAVFLIPHFIILLGCCAYVTFAVTRKTNQPWFERTKPQSESAKLIAHSVAATAAVLLLLHHITAWWIKEHQELQFPIAVKIVPFDSESGEGLRSLTYTKEEATTSRRSNNNLRNFSIGSVGSPNGLHLTLSGIATEPVQLTLKAEGYQNTPITINRQTRSEVKVAMVPSDITKTKKPRHQDDWPSPNPDR